MSRPKRPGGTVSREWPVKLNTFFSDHPKLTKQGIALVLSEIAEELGLKPITVHALYKFTNAKAQRRPTEWFVECWRVLEERLVELREKNIALRSANGRHILAVVDGEPQTVWLPNGVFLRRCYECKVLFIGQWNAKRCPACR